MHIKIFTLAYHKNVTLKRCVLKCFILRQHLFCLHKQCPYLASSLAVMKPMTSCLLGRDHAISAKTSSAYRMISFTLLLRSWISKVGSLRMLSTMSIVVSYQNISSPSCFFCQTNTSRGATYTNLFLCHSYRRFSKSQY